MNASFVQEIQMVNGILLNIINQKIKNSTNIGMLKKNSSYKAIRNKGCNYFICMIFGWIK